MKRILFIVLILLSTTPVFSNTDSIAYPKVGELIKDHIFNDVVNYPQSSLRISDYRGQWLVLDFWGRFCSGCIASFPKIDRLDKAFKNKAKIVMVGLYTNRANSRDEEAYTKNIFKSRAKRYNLQFTNAFDSVAGEKYDIAGIPAIFVINPQGVIVAKTTSLDSADLADLIAGKSPILRPSYSAHETPPRTYNSKLPILTSGLKVNGGVDTAFINRSILGKWQPGMPEYSSIGFEDQSDKDFVQAIGFDLPELYRIAYTGKPIWFLGDSLYGKLSPKLVLKLKDTTLLISNNGVRNSINSYFYQRTDKGKAIMPVVARRRLLEDLNSYFGYNLAVEDHDIDVLKLVVIDSIKVRQLRSKGGETVTAILPDRPGITMKNLPFKDFIMYTVLTNSLKFLYKSYDEMPVLLDATGIKYNIDYVFDVDSSDWLALLEELHKHGLDIVKGKERLQCLVIRE